MTRVSENSNYHAVNYAVGKTKARLEDLQLKGASLKRIQRPSDDPLSNVDVMVKKSQNTDAEQYLRSLNFAQTNLNLTENILDELTNIMVKAKELAIGQSSDVYNVDVRKGVAKEIQQLRLQALSLANKRVGNRYLFGGQKVLTKPFEGDGTYKGDKQKIFVEINKDVFVPINLSGAEIFFDQPRNTDYKIIVPDAQGNMPIDPEANPGPQDTKIDRSIASVNVANDPAQAPVQSSIFDELKTLENALITNNPDIVQSLLEQLDRSTDRIISLRTEIGALTNTVSNAEGNIEKMKLLNEEHRSKMEDADVAELFSNLQKDQDVLKATYKSSSQLMSQKLMDFIR